jgi:hypothetical protein
LVETELNTGEGILLKVQRNIVRPAFFHLLLPRPGLFVYPDSQREMDGRMSVIKGRGVMLALALGLPMFSGCGPFAARMVQPTPTTVKIGASRLVGGIEIVLIGYQLAVSGTGHVPAAKPGYRFLETSWWLRNTTEAPVVIGMTKVQLGRKFFDARSFSPVANHGILRGCEESGAGLWFQIPVHARYLTLVYLFRSGVRRVWHLTIT